LDLISPFDADLSDQGLQEGLALRTVPAEACRSASVAVLGLRSLLSASTESAAAATRSRSAAPGYRVLT
jgi:hypothetical protein